MVPTTRPVRAPDGTLLGVAGVEMTLDRIREEEGRDTVTVYQPLGSIRWYLQEQACLR